MSEDDHDAMHSNEEFSYGGKMYLNNAVTNTVLFKYWRTKTWQDLLLACLFTAGLCFLHEFFEALREFISWKSASRAKSNESKSKKDKPDDENSKLKKDGGSDSKRCIAPRALHFLHTLLYFAQAWLAVLGMLLAMTFNIYICLAITISKAAGYFLFGWMVQYLKRAYGN